MAHKFKSYIEITVSSPDLRIRVRDDSLEFENEANELIRKMIHEKSKDVVTKKPYEEAF